MLAGQVGIGSPSTGTDYTLMSITVVVLGGASVAGGRGSFISTLLGAALVQATSSASSYINANSSVHYTVIGTLTLLAAIFFSLARRRAASAMSRHSGARPLRVVPEDRLVWSFCTASWRWQVTRWSLTMPTACMKA